MTDRRDVLHGTDPEPCWYCGGTGEDQRQPCPSCQASELVPGSYEKKVTEMLRGDCSCMKGDDA